MRLDPGTRLGPYEIVSAIGAGGMGEVYKAWDTRLDRTVAVKVLPSHVGGDPALRERFEREARAVAALNHPHICTLHDVGHQDGIDFLVMEHLDGETLAARLAKGPLPIDQALTVGSQIADALDKAHRAGIVHRDLKPANIVLTKSGAKLLDFGLAKVTPAVIANSGLSMSPTGITPVTIQGMLIGTLQYMAPEQIEGQDADARTDIFAFGSVLYEMITGRPAFQARTQASLIGAILKDTPPSLSSLQPVTAPAVDRFIATCLAKDPDDRWQSARDLVVQLRWLSDAGAQSSSQALVAKSDGRSVRLAWMAFALATVAAVALAVPAAMYFRPPTPPEEIRFLIDTPQTPDSPQNSLAVSPDGRSIAFVAATGPNAYSLFVRRLGSVAAQPLVGTVGAANPFWSPDSRFIAFSAEGLLKKIDVSGGPPLTICEMPGIFRAGTWNSDGAIVFASNSVLNRVSAAGGRSTPISTLDPSRGERYHTSPYFLPDGQHFLYTAWSEDESNTAVYVRSLDGRESKRLLTAPSKALYAPAGFLLYQRNGTVFAQPFDARKLALTEDPVRLADAVSSDPNSPHAAFSISRAGVLIYRTGSTNGQDVQLAWFDRSGKLIEQIGERGAYRGVDLSPDGKRVVFHRHDANGGDVWVMEPARGTTSRLTFDAAQDNSAPIWSPDGARIAFASLRSGTKFGIYTKPWDGSGTEERLVETSVPMLPLSWSPDNKFLVYGTGGAGTSGDVWAVPAMGDRKPVPLLKSRFNESLSEISPDGKWLAYSSDETGRAEIYVRPFPDGAGRWQVSTNGGRAPRWRRDGKELFFLQAARLMATSIQVAGSSLQPGPVHPLFDSGFINLPHLGRPYHSYAVSSDGQRFLFPRPQSVDTSELVVAPITVVLNWTARLKP